jgi:general secretion pathway protein F
MPVYHGKVRTRTNRIKSIEIQARNQDEALEHIERMGRVVTFKRKLSVDLSRALSADERQIFFTRMASMLSARVGTSDALMLMRDTFTGKIQEISARLLNYVESGDDLSSAIERMGAPDFPEATIALIKAGARSGESWRALKDASEFEFQLHSIRKGASKGLITGIFSFIGAGAMTMFSTLYIGPTIMESPLIKSAGENGAINIDWINSVAYFTGYAMAVIMAVAFIFWMVATVGRRIFPLKADKLILRVPYYKDLVLSRNNFIVLYGLALLIKSGVRTEEALRLAAEGAPKGALRNDLSNAMTAVKTGRQWPKVMQTLHPTDKAALLSATDREQVASTLDTLANQYRELYAQRLASFVPIVNLVAALFMTIAGGLLFGQSILPMLMASGGIM